MQSLTFIRIINLILVISSVIIYNLTYINIFQILMLDILLLYWLQKGNDYLWP